MRLGWALFNRRNVTPGFIWTGRSTSVYVNPLCVRKHRLTHKIYPHNLEAYKKRIRLEEQNLFYLRHPYLTVEQEDGHSTAVNRNRQWFERKMVEQYARKVKLSRRTEDQLGFLNVSSSWER